MIKRCSACCQFKAIEEFATNRSKPDGRSNMCRDCKKTYNATYYQATKTFYNASRVERRKVRMEANRRKLSAYLSEHPCVDCGETDIVVLEFDHQGNKEFNISEMISSCMSWTRILAEIDKCEVVCANDHRRRTAHTFGWYKLNYQPPGAANSAR